MGNFEKTPIDHPTPVLAPAQESKQDHPPVSSLRIQLFGDFRLVASKADIPAIAQMPRLQSLLAYLLLHRSASQSRSHLAFLLWPDSTEQQAHTNLRKALYLLRQAFPQVDSFLHIGRQSLSWKTSTEAAAWTLDVQDFEQVFAVSEQAERLHNPTAMRQALAQAVDLYRGDLLPGCYPEAQRARAGSSLDHPVSRNPPALPSEPELGGLARA